MGSDEPVHEDFETRFWLKTVRVGGWVMLLMGFAGTAYGLSFAHGADRDGLVALTVVTICSKFEEVYRRVVASGHPESFVEHYGPLDTTFFAKASPVPGGLSVYLHDVGAVGVPGVPSRTAAAARVRASSSRL